MTPDRHGDRLPARPRKPRRAPRRSGLRASPAGATAGGSRPLVQGTLFTICATYLFVSGILWTPLFGTAVRGRRLPLAAVLAADRCPTGCRAGHQPGPPHPVDPARLPGHLLLLPQGLLPLLLRRSAGLRGRRADDPPRATRWRRPSRSSSRTSTATSCTSRSSRCSSCGSTPSGRSPSRRPVAARARRSSILFVERAAADRLLAVVPLAAPPRRRPARLLLVHAPARRSGTALWQRLTR